MINTFARATIIQLYRRHKLFKHNYPISGRFNKILFKLLNIMFHAPMGRFQLGLIYCFTYFSTVVPFNSCVFLYCRPFVVNATFSTGLVVSSVSWLGQLTVGVYMSTFLDTSFLCSCKIMRVFFHYLSCFCFCCM